MKKFIKTALITCVAVCLIACAGIFATACTDTSKYEITIVSAEDNKPITDAKVLVCSMEDGKIKTCYQSKDYIYEGNKVTVDLSQDEKLSANPVFHIAVTSKNYEFDKSDSNFEYDDGGIIVDTQKHGYSVTIKVKAV